MKTEKFLTIITRFSRKAGFTKTHQSIHSEKCESQVAHLVTCQTNAHEKWLRQFPGIQILRVPPVNLIRWGERPRSVMDEKRYYAPYNFHLTIAAHAAKSKWIGFLDDDDLVIPNRLQALIDQLAPIQDNSWALAQVKYPYHTGGGSHNLPNDELFDSMRKGVDGIIYSNICGLGLLLQRQHIQHMMYGDMSSADFDTAQNLISRGYPMKCLMPGPFFEVGSIGDGSHQFDLSLTDGS